MADKQSRYEFIFPLYTFILIIHQAVEKVQRKLGFFAYLWYNRIRGEEDAGARKNGAQGI